MKRLKRFNEAQLPFDDDPGEYQDYDDWDDDGDDDGDDNYDSYKEGTWGRLVDDMNSGKVISINCDSVDIEDDINLDEKITTKSEIKNGLYKYYDFIIVFNGYVPSVVIGGYNPSSYIFKDTVIVLSKYDFHDEIICYDRQSNEFEIIRKDTKKSDIKKIKTDTSEDITWSELLDKIDSEDIKLIDCKKSQIQKSIPNNILDEVIGKSKKGKSQIKNYTVFFNDIVVIFDYDGIPEAVVIIDEPENSESILFKDAIIITQPNEIIYYDRVTGESARFNFNDNQRPRHTAVGFTH